MEYWNYGMMVKTALLPPEAAFFSSNGKLVSIFTNQKIKSSGILSNPKFLKHRLVLWCSGMVLSQDSKIFQCAVK
jgi:hypothetical protein